MANPPTRLPQPPTQHEPRPVVVGAGPGGAVAAYALAQAGQACLLLDRATFPRDKICGDALSGKVLEVLRKLEPDWADDLHRQAEPLPAWGVAFGAPNGRVLRVPFHLGPRAGAKPPGYVSTRVFFDDWLLAKCASHPLVELRTGWQATATQPNGKARTLDLKGPQGERLRLNTPLVIAADGAQSRLARQTLRPMLAPRHHCAAVRGYWQGVEGLDAEGFIELHFLPEALPGYFWIFPLANGHANVGLGMRSDVVAKRRVNLKALMQQVIDTHPRFRSRFAQAKPLGAVQGFGLPTGTRRWPLVDDRLMLVGDAGSLIDPFTGEGIGNAMISGRLAALVAAQVLQAGQVPSADALRLYQQQAYARLWPELRLSRWLQHSLAWPGLFNLVVNRALANPTLAETISCMFDDLGLRQRLRSPRFYVNLVLGR